MEAQSTTMHLLQLLLMLFGVDQAGLPPGEPDLVVQRAAPVTAVYRSEWTAPGKGDPGAPGIDGFLPMSKSAISGRRWIVPIVIFLKSWITILE